MYAHINFFAVGALRCYQCGDNDEAYSCDRFIHSSKYMVRCDNRHDSCIQTLGSFGDFSGNITLFNIVVSSQLDNFNNIE